MRIVVIGGGEVGSGIARRLAARHDVVVIEQRRSVADRLAGLDVQVLTGNGASPDVLEQADVARCDLLVAATGMDEVNVLASLIANRLGSPTTICLVSRADLLQPLGDRDLLRQHCGIDRVVWPEAQLAEDIERIIAAPGAIDAESFEQGRITLIGYRVAPGSPFAAVPLASLDLPEHLLVVALKRGDRFSIPNGRTVLTPGDKVFLMGTTDAIEEMQHRLGAVSGEARQTVTIIGGGDVGLQLAQRLERRGFADVRIIERNPTRGEMLAAALHQTLVLQGDGTDLELLESEDIGRSDVLVAAIDSDERNLFASLLARQLGVKRIISRVGRQSNLRLFERVGIDVALSARTAAIAAIVHLAEGGTSRLLAVLEEGQAQIVEVHVPVSHAPKPLRTLPRLSESIVGAVIRDGAAIVPNGDHEIRAGDRLLVFTTTTDVEAVRDYFAGPD
jgi:trk system potassium uptake protein TrkA